MWIFRGRQLRAGRGRRLDRSEQEFIYWALTREDAPATVDQVAAVFGVHRSSIYRVRADMAAVARAQAEHDARRAARAAAAEAVAAVASARVLQLAPRSPAGVA